jgi:tRNA1Val (adenine37-N6)-methyltransferase
MSSTDQFKGWTKPGPRLSTEPQPVAGVTLDAISGHFRIYQLRDGHRFSTDDILTAWYGTAWAPSVERALDLGSGIGTVAMVAAWRLPGAQFTTVEAQEVSVALARKSAIYNQLINRFDIRQGDFRDAGILGVDELFDLVLGSPPYFPLGTGIEGDHPQKIACRFEVRGNVKDYCKVACEHLAPGGVFALIFPQQDDQARRVAEGAKENGLTIVRQRPVRLREQDAPLLCLHLMARSADLPEWMRDRTWKEPDLIIRTKEGAIHPEYSAIKMSFGFPP